MAGRWSSGVRFGLAAGRAGGDSSGRDGGEGRDAELDEVAAPGGDLVHLGELASGAGQADLEAFGLADPVVLLGFGDACGQVLADLDQTWPLGWVGAQQRAAKAGVFMDAGSLVGAPAVTQGHLA